MLLEPGYQRPDASIGPVAVLLGKRGELVEQLPLAGGVGRAGGGRGRGERGDGVVFEGCEVFRQQARSVVVGVGGGNSQAAGGGGEREGGLRCSRFTGRNGRGLSIEGG